jgi:hypothetical protein
LAWRATANAASEGEFMPQEHYDKEKIADEIKAGRPERYFDYLSKTYWATFQTGTAQALETFRELLRQILALGNERSTLLFAERFFPMLPQDARRKIFNEFMRELERIKARSQAANIKWREALLKRPTRSA